MNKKLKPCPSCGGEAELIEYYETCDGRGDKLPEIKCKCGLKMTFTFDEFYKVRDDFNYVGGYYSDNKELWNGIHQRLINKWNTRKPIDNIVEELGKEERRAVVNYHNSRGFKVSEAYGQRIAFERAIEIVKGGVE